MGIPKRVRKTTGRHSLVDGIPFELPVVGKDSPVLVAVYTINLEKAKALLPPTEIHPLRIWKKALLVIAVIDYRYTSIGTYVEYSIGIACTHGWNPAPRFLPLIFQKHYGVGQYVVDLPVSSLVSVRGGKGIWGMPKHQGNLDFKICDDKISSQYDLDGQLCTYIEIEHPGKAWFPAKMQAANYCSFRGMMFKSTIYFNARTAFRLGGKAKAKFVIGDHPRVQKLKELEISDQPLFTAFIPTMAGVLDDHTESWFVHFDEPPESVGEGMESVVNLPLSEEWLAPPNAPVPGVSRND